MDNPRFSVVIPLYNKREGIVKAVRSASSQTLQPLEIIVIDDGSTDGGADALDEMDYPLLKVIVQTNAGVSAARNRGIAEAKGNYIAFLDADDWWDEGFLQKIAQLIDDYPQCGIYCTGFRVHRKSGIYPGDAHPLPEGVVENYFHKAFTHTIVWTSACVMPRSVLESVGGFPEGMRRGQDLYMWTKAALKFPVCYSPSHLSNYNLLTLENSRTRYKLEPKEYSFLDFYEPGRDELNEYLARYQIGLGILQSVGGHTTRARKVARDCSFTRRYRRGLRKLRVLNSLPAAWRGPALSLYNRLALCISGRGALE